MIIRFLPLRTVFSLAHIIDAANIPASDFFSRFEEKNKKSDPIFIIKERKTKHIQHQTATHSTKQRKNLFCFGTKFIENADNFFVVGCFFRLFLIKKGGKQFNQNVWNMYRRQRSN